MYEGVIMGNVEEFDLYFRLGLDNGLYGFDLVMYSLFMIRAFPHNHVNYPYSLEWVERFKKEKYLVRYMDDDKMKVYHEVHKTLINLLKDSALIL